jgi:excisionase family DNA binding protein
MTVEKSTAGLEKSYLRIPEIAENLDVSVGLVYRWVRQGKLKGWRFGKQTVRTHRHDYEQFLQDVVEALEGGILLGDVLLYLLTGSPKLSLCRPRMG